MCNRFKNYGLWFSILAFIPVVLEAFEIHVLPSNYEDIIKSFLGILVVAGILNNPDTKCRGYSDDENKDNEETDEEKKK